MFFIPPETLNKLNASLGFAVFAYILAGGLDNAKSVNTQNEK
jgi:hypothetical protein